jgi:hypothetical protein
MAVPKSKKGLNKRINKIHYKKFSNKVRNSKNNFFTYDLKTIKNVNRVFLI